jgi:nudix-type nucleoside diphosphatase (YffH/AdpP family)
MKNPVKDVKKTVLCHNWGTLNKLEYEFEKRENFWEKQTREVYDRGDGVTIFLFNRETKKILLTKQFRIPTYINGNSQGFMIETCAGKLDVPDPAECIQREVLEETGHKIPVVKKIFSIYMSPGSVTELIHFYIGEYTDEMKIEKGGGNESEQENIEILQITLPEALSMMETGEIKDGKTIILLQYAAIQKLV